MAEISEILDILWNPPRKRDRHPEMPSPNRFKPEDFGYYKKWGFAIYRTYYGTKSDQHWNSLFRLFPHEDPSHLEGLDINGIREVCRKQHHEANQKMAEAKFCFALVADEAVLDGIARNEFVVKAVGYDWDRIDHGGWGWVRLETGRLLELWEALLLADVQSTNKYYWMKCDGPESDLETDIWTGDWSLPDLDIYSKVQTASKISQLKFDY
ncbi:hypothetical protein ACKAV7_003876 [Fusarium commune]